jgi:hypothetical protein
MESQEPATLAWTPLRMPFQHFTLPFQRETNTQIVIVTAKLSAKELLVITTMELSALDEEALPTSALQESKLRSARTRLPSPR